MGSEILSASGASLASLAPRSGSSSSSSSSSSSLSAAPAPAASGSGSGGGGGSGSSAGNFVSEREVRRLEESVREHAEVNDRVMAQNIALLADLEAAQRTVRDLRASNNALAVQLRRAMEDKAKAGSSA